MRQVTNMERAVAVVLGVVLLFAALLGLPMLMGVWLPDVMVAQDHLLAEQRLTNGYCFRIVQYWNRVDFYSTELRITSPDGHVDVHTLDGDDSKSWHLPLTIDEQRRTATVILGGGR